MATEFEQRRLSRTMTPAAIDEGLRAHMLRVYNYMAGGLGITGIAAYATASSPGMMNAIWNSGLGWLVVFAPLGLVLFLSFRIHKMSFSTAQMTFWVYSGIMGLSMSSIFWVYPIGDIARVFFITAAMFAAMSLWGYTTKRDLTGMGSFMMMGLIGIIIAMVVNIFLANAVMDFVISAIGVVIFTGLTAYDTQKIKNFYSDADGMEIAGKKAVMGALNLYLDFINLFLMLLRLFGNRN